MNPAIFAHFNGETIVLDEPFELKPIYASYSYDFV
jgi:hypothetical protein